jgi:hypothetical protein
VVVDNQQGKLSRLDLQGNNCLFINSVGSVCSVSREGVKVLVDGCIGFRCYAHGIITLPLEKQRRVIERRDHAGRLQDTIDLQFQLSRSWMISTSGNEIITTKHDTIEKVDLRTRIACTIAGSTGKPGYKDGHGADARFHHLKAPNQHDENRIIVRDIQPDGSSRICRVDLATYEVCTLRIRGIEDVKVAHFSCVFPNLLLISEEGVLYQANLSEAEDVHASTFRTDMAAVDWSEPVQEIQFRLSDGPTVRADGRVLCARSQYFAAMLDPDRGFKESQGIVDLVGTHADADALRAVLKYLSTDEFDIVKQPQPQHKQRGQPESDGRSEAANSTRAGTGSAYLEQAIFCLHVAQLADQYQLPRLAGLAEAFVVRVALPDRDDLVLPLLEASFGTGCAVEEACWEAFRKRAVAIVNAMGQDSLATLVARSPQLGAQLVLSLARMVQPTIDMTAS